MNNREIVVRIIQPAEQPAIRRVVAVSARKREKNLFQTSLNVLGVAAIAAAGIFLVFSFFNVGFSFKDILIMVGLPLAVGIVASYAIF